MVSKMKHSSLRPYHLLIKEAQSLSLLAPRNNVWLAGFPFQGKERALSPKSLIPKFVIPSRGTNARQTRQWCRISYSFPSFQQVTSPPSPPLFAPLRSTRHAMGPQLCTSSVEKYKNMKQRYDTTFGQRERTGQANWESFFVCSV